MKRPVIVLMALCLLTALFVSCATIEDITKDQEPLKDDAQESVVDNGRPKTGHNEGGDIVADEFDGATDKELGPAGALVMRGRRLLDDGDTASAIAVFSEAISINPELADAYYYRATAYDEAIEYESAVRDFTKVISINPSYVRAYFGRGSVYVKDGDTNKAIDDFAKACDMRYTPACKERESLTGVLSLPVFQGGKIDP